MPTFDGHGHPFDGAEIVSIYTREDALRDGVFVDVTECAAKSGWAAPVALTDSLAVALELHDDKADWNESALTAILADWRRAFAANHKEGEALTEYDDPDLGKLWLAIENDGTGRLAATIMFPSDY